MSLPVSEELMKDMALMVFNYKRICQTLGLSEEQMLTPNAGEWIVQTIKQYSTAFLLSKTVPPVEKKDDSPTLPNIEDPEFPGS